MFKQTKSQVNIWRASQEDVFEFDFSAEPYRVRFDDEKLRRTYGQKDNEDRGYENGRLVPQKSQRLIKTSNFIQPSDDFSVI
jgi:hypothetical protein